MGGVTDICSDKTGTITKGDMIFEKVYVNQEMIDIEKFNDCVER